MFLRQNLLIVFPNRKQMVQHAILELVAKTMEKCVMSTLEFYIITTSFDLWMSKSGHDIFAFVINFINSHWVPRHVIVGFI
jgi:putative flippase GtrA